MCSLSLINFFEWPLRNSVTPPYHQKTNRASVWHVSGVLVSIQTEFDTVFRSGRPESSPVGLKARTKIAPALVLPSDWVGRSGNPTRLTSVNL